MKKLSIIFAIFLTSATLFAQKDSVVFHRDNNSKVIILAENEVELKNLENVSIDSLLKETNKEISKSNFASDITYTIDYL